MARKRERIFAAFGASLFLITSSALTIIVIVLLVQGNNTKKAPTTVCTVSNIKSSDTSKSTQTGEIMQNFTPTSTPQSKLETIDTVCGTGAEVKANDTVTVEYTGALMTTGVIFDASANHGGTATFGLNQVIQGWTLGIPGMQVGGTRRLLIPAALAYGASSPSAAIPANSDLVFDVTLVKIN